jgi:hypothetical protein
MIYGTYGGGCEHFRFKRVKPGVYQRVARVLGIFWWPVGQQLRDHDSMFFPIRTRGVGGRDGR